MFNQNLHRLSASQPIAGKRSVRVKLTALVLFMSVGFAGPAFACTCADAKPFFEVAHKTPVIVYGDVESHDNNSLMFHITEVLHGVETRKRIRVWGDNGVLCRPYVSQFPVGTKWVFAIYRVSPSTGRGSLSAAPTPDDEKTDYAISICGEFALKVAGESAYGSFPQLYQPPTEPISLEKLRQRIRRWQNK